MYGWEPEKPTLCIGHWEWDLGGVLVKLFHTFCSVQPECNTVPLNRHMASSAQTSWSVLLVPASRELTTERFPSYEAVKCHFVCMFSKCLKDIGTKWNGQKMFLFLYYHAQGHWEMTWCRNPRKAASFGSFPITRMIIGCDAVITFPARSQSSPTFILHLM